MNTWILKERGFKVERNKLVTGHPQQPRLSTEKRKTLLSIGSRRVQTRERDSGKEEQRKDEYRVCIYIYIYLRQEMYINQCY